MSVLGRLGGVLGHIGGVLGRLWGATWGTLLHMGARAGPPLRQKTFAIVGNENCWKNPRPESENIGNHAGIRIFMRSQLLPDKTRLFYGRFHSPAGPRRGYY